MKGFISRIVLAIVVVVVVIFAIYTVVNITDSNTKELLGIQVVKSLYEYQTISDFEDNIATFKSLVSNTVFDRLTANNTDRVLSVYLKFNGNPCSVNIIESSFNYVVYSLVSESIEPERVFILVFEIFNGKITDIKEAELVVFPTTNGWAD